MQKWKLKWLEELFIDYKTKNDKKVTFLCVRQTLKL